MTNKYCIAMYDKFCKRTVFKGWVTKIEVGKDGGLHTISDQHEKNQIVFYVREWADEWANILQKHFGWNGEIYKVEEKTTKNG